MYFVNLTFSWFGDCSTMYQLGFQDPATSTMEGIFLFNLDLFFVIISIVFLVAWLIFILLKNFIDSNNSIVQTSSHSNMLNIIWTSIPALILLSLVSPLFSLPHNFDEILPNPELTLTLWDLIFFVISPRELILITFNLFLIYAVLAHLWFSSRSAWICLSQGWGGGPGMRIPQPRSSMIAEYTIRRRARAFLRII